MERRYVKARIHAFGDTHCGSTVGLAPNQPIPHPEGATIEPTPASRWLHDQFIRQIEAEKKDTEAQGCDRSILLLMGDLVDGLMHHGQIQLYHPEGAVEKWIAREIVREAMEILDPDHVGLVLGTPSHVGKMGGKEEDIGAFLDAHWPGRVVRPNDRRYGHHVFRFVSDGCLVDARHHGKMGRLPHTRDSYQKRYAFDVWSSQAMYIEGKPATLAFRAHRHQYADSGPVPSFRHGTRLISLPCYQLGTEWVTKMALEDPAHIGMVGVTIDDGRPRDPYETIVIPTLPGEDQAWQLTE